MTATADDIIAACESEWDEHKADCSGFANAVAARLHVPLHGMANNIVTAISQPPWSRLPDGVEAAKSAAAGRFVVAGLQGSAQAAPSQHGHVVVVVKGDLAHGKYPTAYWGRLGSVGSKAQTINFAWNQQDRDKVIYAAMEATV
jgi:hypothetical protein